jgi:hypothetical protein
MYSLSFFSSDLEAMLIWSSEVGSALCYDSLICSGQTSSTSIIMQIEMKILPCPLNGSNLSRNQQLFRSECVRQRRQRSGSYKCWYFLSPPFLGSPRSGCHRVLKRFRDSTFPLHWEPFKSDRFFSLKKTPAES